MALVSDPPPPAPASGRGDPDAPPFQWYMPFVVGLGLYVVIGIFAAAVAGALGWHTLPDRFAVVLSIIQDVLMIALAYLVARASGPSPRFNLGLRRFKLSRGLLYAVGAFVGFFVFLAVWTLALNVTQEDDLAQNLGANDSTTNLVLIAVLVCLVAPVAEELCFRGFLYGARRRSIGWLWAAVV